MLNSSHFFKSISLLSATNILQFCESISQNIFPTDFEISQFLGSIKSSKRIQYCAEILHYIIFFDKQFKNCQISETTCNMETQKGKVKKRRKNLTNISLDMYVFAQNGKFWSFPFSPRTYFDLTSIFHSRAFGPYLEWYLDHLGLLLAYPRPEIYIKSNHFQL